MCNLRQIVDGMWFEVVGEKQVTSCATAPNIEWEIRIDDGWALCQGASDQTKPLPLCIKPPFDAKILYVPVYLKASSAASMRRATSVVSSLLVEGAVHTPSCLNILPAADGDDSDGESDLGGFEDANESENESDALTSDVEIAIDTESSDEEPPEPQKSSTGGRKRKRAAKEYV